MDRTELGCAHRAMSADGPRGECMSCLIADRARLRALLARAVVALESVPDPGMYELKLIEELRKA